MGHLIIMIGVHNIQVSRHFSYATLLFVFGEVPTNDTLMNPNVVNEELMFELEQDFSMGGLTYGHIFHLYKHRIQQPRGYWKN